MTNDIADDKLAELIRANAPDVVLATAITPMIYQAQKTLEIAKREAPGCVTVLGGIHPTFMYAQVLGEAPWIDYIVRGEGEEIAVELLQAIQNGTDRAERRQIQGIAFLEDGKLVATPARPVIRDLDALTPDWSLLEWDKYIYIPLGCRVAVPNFARGCPFTCRFCSQWKFWRKYRTRDPKKFVDEIEVLVREHQVGFFILADEEPTINRRKFVALCEELIRRDLGVKWGINTRVTDILRDRELLPLFRKETTIEQNKLAIKLIKDAGMVAEAQFIMGLENETAETIEETYRLAQDWKPDMAHWNMYTPWPFAELFEELGDKVEVRDYAKYNFVTPIIQPEEITRDQVLKGVMRNYARFYMRKSFLEYPWIRDKFKRRYMMGCLKAFAKTTATKKFYDLERLKFNGVSAQWDLGFDETKVLNGDAIAALKRERPDLAADVNFKGTRVKVMACGGGSDGERQAAAALAET